MEIFPAYAGLNPKELPLGKYRIDIPRIRGGEPKGGA